MNWDMVSAVAELVAATAVVISLVYLATQVRTSNRLARAEAWRSRFSDLTNLNASFGVNPLFHHAMVKVHQGALEADLSPDELALVSSYVISVATAVEQTFLEAQEGVLDQHALDRFVGQTVFQFPFYRANWQFHRRILSSAFADYVEARYGLGSSEEHASVVDAP